MVLSHPRDLLDRLRDGSRDKGMLLYPRPLKTRRAEYSRRRSVDEFLAQQQQAGGRLAFTGISGCTRAQDCPSDVYSPFSHYVYTASCLLRSTPLSFCTFLRHITRTPAQWTRLGVTWVGCRPIKLHLSLRGSPHREHSLSWRAQALPLSIIHNARVRRGRLQHRPVYRNHGERRLSELRALWPMQHRYRGYRGLKQRQRQQKHDRTLCKAGLRASTQNGIGSKDG